MEPGLQNFMGLREVMRGGVAAMEAAPAIPNPIEHAFLKLVIKYLDRIIDAKENGTPLLCTWLGNALEVYGAMDLPFFCPAEMTLATLSQNDALDCIHNSPMPDDGCALIELSIESVRNQRVPTPTIISTHLMPCDGMSVLHEMWRTTPGWEHIPHWRLDPPLTNTPEDFAYYAGEIRREIAFLEEQTGRKLDWDRLREVCEQSNQVYAAWDDLAHLCMSKPAPLPSFVLGEMGWMPTLHIGMPGDPDNLEFFNLMIDIASKNVEEGIAAVPGEQIRLLWADVNGPWNQELLAPWLEETYGAVVAASFQGRTPYTMIDTSSEQRMLETMAQRHTAEPPMLRQIRGNADVICQDIRDFVRDYQLDCVVVPGHKGHKDKGGDIAYIRQTCREIGVPLLVLSCDVFDPSYTPVDQIKRSFKEFFESQGWRPLQ